EVNCSKLNARVRNIQVHGVEYSKARCGQRVALNLAGIKREQVSRGDIIASPGTLTESTRFNAWLHYVGIPQKDAYSAEQFRLKDGMSVHIHHATRETTGRVRLLYSEDMDKQERPKILERGTAAFVQIRLDNALPVSVNDHFIVRSISPAFTIAGGTVLECEADASPRVKLSPAKLRFLKLLRDKSYNQAIDALFELSALPYNSEQIAQSLHVPKRQVAAILNQASGLVRFKSDIESFYLSHTALNKLKDRILSKLLDYHQANPQALDISVGALQDLLWKSSSAQVFTWNDSRFEAILEQMHDAEIIVFRNGRVQHPESASAVQAAQEELAAALLHRINSQNLAVENMQELADSLGYSRDLTAQVLGQLTRDKQLIRLSGEFHFAPHHVKAAKDILQVALSKNPEGMTAAQLRDELQVSRKYAIPLLEHFDAQNITLRKGDLRILAG
ncbi:MAG: SelB C-terminal domain-containing protein, partial [Coriobacteriia bacterium]|nr:SelB C-terminal domain-containing protein [Coriobacteriia bacterium]